MHAIRLTNGHLQLDKSAPTPEPPDGSVRVRVTQAGICETDLQLVSGYMGFEGILGHEFVGVAQSGRFEGQRVVGEINCVCNACEFCNQGLGNHCPNRTVIGILNHDGAFAEFVIVPEENLHAVPDELSDDLATLVEPVAAALQIREQVPLPPGKRCYVVGDGRLGNLCAQALIQADCDVSVIGKHADKLARFADLGISTYLLEQRSELPQADLVVDCAGTESGMSTAIALSRPRGTVVMKTTVANVHSLDLSPIVINEITVVGSRCGPFDKALNSLVAGRFKIDNFVSGRYPLEDYSAAFEHAKRKDALKVIMHN